MRAVTYYCASQGSSPGEGVSLVGIPSTGDEGSPTGFSDFVLVQWTIPGKRGRIADVDEHNFIKCIVPVGAKKEPLKLDELEAKIIIPRTGAYVIRERRNATLRSQANLNRLPDDLVRLLNILRAGQSNMEDSDLESLDVCFCCGHGELGDLAHHSALEVSGVMADVHPSSRCTVCPFCLLCSHDECCKSLVSHFNPDDYDGDPARLASCSSFSVFEDEFLAEARRWWGLDKILCELYVCVLCWCWCWCWCWCCAAVCCVLCVVLCFVCVCVLCSCVLCCVVCCVCVRALCSCVVVCCVAVCLCFVLCQVCCVLC